MFVSVPNPTTVSGKLFKAIILAISYVITGLLTIINSFVSGIINLTIHFTDTALKLLLKSVLEFSFSKLLSEVKAILL